MSVKGELANLFFSAKAAGCDESSFAMGHVLKQERIRQGYSIKTVAGALNLTSAYISQLESGKKVNPTIRVIEAYLDFLGIDMLDLVLRMKVTETPTRERLDELISEIGNTLETLKAVRKMGGENNEKS